MKNFTIRWNFVILVKMPIYWINKSLPFLFSRPTSRKFLYLHWRGLLGGAPGPRSNKSPAPTQSSTQNKNWFGHSGSMVSKGDQENGRVTSWSNEMSILLFLDYSEFRRDSDPDVIFLKLKKFIDFQEYIPRPVLSYISWQFIWPDVTKCTTLAVTIARICQIITHKYWAMHKMTNNQRKFRNHMFAARINLSLNICLK